MFPVQLPVMMRRTKSSGSPELRTLSPVGVEGGRSAAARINQSKASEEHLE
jgi:hypothetical protein